MLPTVRVEIDLEALILKAATRFMDNKWEHESASVLQALQELIADQTDVQIIKRVRQQVKEYKTLTQWR